MISTKLTTRPPARAHFHSTALPETMHRKRSAQQQEPAGRIEKGPDQLARRPEIGRGAGKPVAGQISPPLLGPAIVCIKPRCQSNEQRRADRRAAALEGRGDGARKALPSKPNWRAST